MYGRRVIQLTLAAALVLAVAAPAAARGAEVTSGDFVTLQAGADLGYDISGHAVMRRSPADGGLTVVGVHLYGLDPNTAYPTHVHNAPCSGTPPGGSHYQNEVGGAVDGVNEIWPTVTTNASGKGSGSAAHGAWARPDAMSIVVHNPANTAIRLACADLG